MEVAFVTVHASVVIEETTRRFMASKMFACYIVLFCSCRFSFSGDLGLGFLFPFTVNLEVLESLPCHCGVSPVSSALLW